MTKLRDGGGYWLPEEHVLKLTALEVGYLLATVHSSDDDYFVVNKPGPNGERLKTTMRERLIEKIEAAIAEAQRGGVPAGTVPVAVPGNSRQIPAIPTQKPTATAKATARKPDMIK